MTHSKGIFYTCTLIPKSKTFDNVLSLSNFVKGFVFLSFIFHFTTLEAGDKYIKYSDLASSCYESIIMLKMDDAQVFLANLKKKEPDNLVVLHLENYIDFFTIFISEDEQEYKSRSNNEKERLNYLDDHKIASPYYQFIKAEILLQWALVRLKFDEKITAGSEVYEAYKLLEANKKQYPTFLENNKSLSIIHALAQSLPKWVRTIIGVKGSIALGTSEIQTLANAVRSDKNYLFREEVAAIYSYILFYQNNNKDKAISILQEFDLDHKTNPLAAFLKASIYQRAGQNELCIEVLTNRPKGEAFMDFYYLDFMLGKSKLYRLDQDAGSYMERFVTHFKGRHYIKEAYQKLAWYELAINNDAAAYQKNLQNCKQYGNELIDEDKQAMKEANNGKIPHPSLLKSRLLYDGGYYDKAIQALANYDISKTNNLSFMTELNYRLGRIYQAKLVDDKAIIYLKKCYQLGQPLQDYYACGAALQLGLIFEKEKKYDEAKKYFNYCTKLSPDEYKSSLHQKAKSGLERLKNY